MFSWNAYPIAPGWDYVIAAGFKGEVRGEVVGCPGEEAAWTPSLVAGEWWKSPAHFQALYADREANLVACGVYGFKNGRFRTAACITLKHTPINPL